MPRTSVEEVDGKQVLVIWCPAGINRPYSVPENVTKEVKERYEALNLKPYGGFINPDIVPVEKDGKIVDYKVVYNDDYLKQQLDYGKKYGAL